MMESRFPGDLRHGNDYKREFQRANTLVLAECHGRSVHSVGLIQLFALFGLHIIFQSS